MYMYIRILIPFYKNNKKLITCQATTADFRLKQKIFLFEKKKKNTTRTHTQANFFKNWLCPNFSSCPKNLSCPNFGGRWGTAALAPRPNGPMVKKDSFKNILRGFSQNITSFSFEASIAMKDRNFVRFRVLLPYTNVSSFS